MMTDKEKLEKLKMILDIDTVGWATPRDLIDTLRREVLEEDTNSIS